MMFEIFPPIIIKEEIQDRVIKNTRRGKSIQLRAAAQPLSFFYKKLDDSRRPRGAAAHNDVSALLCACSERRRRVNFRAFPRPISRFWRYSTTTPPRLILR